MQRLIDHKLIYGGLLEVRSPTWRARYNRALEELCNHRTELESFRIDLCGFSPEVAEEIGDPDYLNPHGCNRRFILLSLEQADLPVIGATFSTTRAILERFIEDNQETLFALTARDAVFGELENSTFRIDDLEDLLAIRRIRVEVKTTRQLIDKSRKLDEMIQEFHREPDSWQDEIFLRDMVELAEATGDIRQQSVVPDRLDYEQGNFFTTHFGGLYAFLDAKRPTLISCGPDFDDDGLPSGHDHLPLDDHEAVAGYLAEAGLVTNLAEQRSPESREILRQKLDFMVIDRVAQSEDGAALDEAGPEDMKRFIRENLDHLPEAFHGLSDLLRALEQDRPLPELEPEHPSYFYLLRAADHRDRDLVNHLLARLTPLDLRQLFICNKELFYERYIAWPEAKRAFTAAYLSRHYLGAEEAVYETLYGPMTRAAASRRSRIPASGAERFASRPWDQARR